MTGAAYFSEVRLANHLSLEEVRNDTQKIQDRHILKEFLEYIHIKKGLLEAYSADYPLIDARELLPSFEVNFAEYKFLPCFSMVVFNRPLEYQQEVFQFDLLHKLTEAVPDKTVSQTPASPGQGEVAQRKYREISPASHQRTSNRFQEKVYPTGSYQPVLL